MNTLFSLDIAKADVVYTPSDVAANIIKYLQPSGVILDPCAGSGAFFKNFPEGKHEYCELSEGSDFLNYNKKVDWIIGNPPYSIFQQFLEHSFSLANDVSFLVPTNKIFQRQVIMDSINKWGGLHSIIVFGSGSLIGFPFGFSVGNFHFKKGYKGSCRLMIGMKAFNQFKSQGQLELKTA